ncbi:pyridoxal-phosphate dependent enzyme [bacterium]|nr:pyridoxal-phosphate dependent enzyme [bacterium]
METFAEGLATRVPFMLPQQILWEHLDDFILVEDDEMKRAVLLYLEKAKTLAEPAGAASLAVIQSLASSNARMHSMTAANRCYANIQFVTLSMDF